jgi:hypothetical protein
MTGPAAPEPNFSLREEEYWYHVSPQETLPLAGQVEVNMDLERISRFFKLTAQHKPCEARRLLSQQLIAYPPVFSEVRQFLGISDKRAYLDLSYISSRTPHPTHATSLCGCQPWTLARHPLQFFLALLGDTKGKAVQDAAATMMADYLLKHGLAEAAASFANMSIDVLQLLYARLISPKEYQQRAAKRRGHGCEGALASLLSAANLTIVPADKAANPMGSRDPNVNLTSMELVERSVGSTHSFDMVIFHNNKVRVLIQSLIHTSDPGQYGVNKSDETVEIMRHVRRWREKNPSQPAELWLLVDGVGFSENKPDTINKLLKEADYFVQLRSLYKAALRAHEIGLTRVSSIAFAEIYSPSAIEQLKKLYVPKGVKVLTLSQLPVTDNSFVSAGQASVAF